MYIYTGPHLHTVGWLEFGNTYTRSLLNHTKLITFPHPLAFYFPPIRDLSFQVVSCKPRYTVFPTCPLISVYVRVRTFPFYLTRSNTCTQPYIQFALPLSVTHLTWLCWTLTHSFHQLYQISPCNLMADFKLVPKAFKHRFKVHYTIQPSFPIYPTSCRCMI